MRASGLCAALAAIAVLDGCSGVHRTGEGEFATLLARADPQPGELVATFFQTGLGDAVLLELPTGKTLLVDAGVGCRISAIKSYLRARGVARLDGLLLTHPHLDHYGGMRQLVEGFEVGTFYSSGERSDSFPFEALEAALDARDVPRVVVRRGDRLADLEGEGVTVEVLYPDDEAIRTVNERNQANHGSVVLRVTHGTQRFLLTGDCEWLEEERLLALEGTRLRAEVLKLGHHASLLSGKPEFLRTVSPRLAIAQGTDGGNVPPIYPRPSPRITWTLRDMGVPFLTTDRQGAVQVVSDGSSVRWSTPFGVHLRRNGSLRLSRAAFPETGTPCSIAQQPRNLPAGRFPGNLRRRSA
jgi:competence protein ComEC